MRTMTPTEHAALLRGQAVEALMQASDAPPGPERSRLLAQSESFNLAADDVLAISKRGAGVH